MQKDISLGLPTVARQLSSGNWAHCAVVLEVLEERTLLSVTATEEIAAGSYAWVNVSLVEMEPYASVPPSNALTPTQVRSAYGIDQILFGSVSGDGSGQTVAVIDAYDLPTALSDLNTFSTYYGLPLFNVEGGPTFTKVGQTGGAVPGTDPNGPTYLTGTISWAVEASLDIQWVHAIAPMANILLVEANDHYTNNLFAAVNWAKSQPGVVAISMSFGSTEFSSETGNDSTFTTPANHPGVTFLAASGDSGSPAGYPAYSPNVVAVGGTSLTVSGTNYVSEAGWSGSGGGISLYESQPTYQQGVVTQSTTKRTAPDVSMVADPNTGVVVYDSYDYPNSPWLKLGGTSLSAPLWAGLIAIANQGRELAGLSSLDGATQTLPTLYSLPAADFHDITTGSNGGYTAGAGYDLVTGLGTPIADRLILDLAGIGTVTGAVYQDNNGNGLLDLGEPGLAGVQIYLDSNNNGIYEAAVTNTVASTDTPKSIPDNDSAGVTSTLTFSGSGNITDVTVTLSITHSNDSNLSAFLIGPDGTQVTLFSGVGGSGNNFTDTTFSDGASTNIASGTAPFTGTYRPASALAAFDGLSSGGTWTLKVTDTRRRDTGTLTAWSLTLTTGETATTTDADGNYALVLPSGNYTIRQIVPTNTMQTGPDPGASPAGAYALTVGGVSTGKNFGNFPTVIATAGAGAALYVRLDSEGANVQISRADSPMSTPTYQVSLGLLPSLTLDLQGTANRAYIDFANGSPIPVGDIRVLGNPAGGGTLTVLGQSASQAFSLDDSQIAPAGDRVLTYTDIATLAIRNCAASLAGSLLGGESLTIGAGATLVGGGGTIERSVLVSGGTLSGPISISGNLSSTGGTVAPGGGVIGAISVSGNAAFDATSTLVFDLSAPDNPSGANDLITVAGDLSLAGTVQVVGLAGFATGGYRLVTCAGLLLGAGLVPGPSTPSGFNFRVGSGGGQVNLFASAWALGDTNQNGAVDSPDLDAIFANFGNVTANLSLARYDMTGDNIVSIHDVNHELYVAMGRTYGDANLDGAVDFIDFQILLDHWQAPALWANGDFNGDQVCDFDDFQRLLDFWNPTGVNQADNSQTSAPAVATDVATASPATTDFPTVTSSYESQIDEIEAFAVPVFAQTATVVAATSEYRATAARTLTNARRALLHRHAGGDAQTDLLADLTTPVFAWHRSRG